MTFLDFCKGKTIDHIKAEPQGNYGPLSSGGSFVAISFTDGTRVWITDAENAFDKDGNRVEVD